MGGSGGASAVGVLPGSALIAAARSVFHVNFRLVAPSSRITCLFPPFRLGLVTRVAVGGDKRPIQVQVGSPEKPRQSPRLDIIVTELDRGLRQRDLILDG